MSEEPLAGIPDPAVVVLVGASGSGKSTWAARRYRREEVVSSDDLRGIVGSGRHDLDATDDAFRLLDQIVSARTGRGLTTVIDTLGLDAARRRDYLSTARRAGLPAVAVHFDVPARLCRERNASRDRPVPAPVLAAQVTRALATAAELADESWDVVVTVADAVGVSTDSQVQSRTADSDSGRSGREQEVVLQISRFPWGEDPAAWLTEMAFAADAAGFTGLALMDHLIQIPQVGRRGIPSPNHSPRSGCLRGWTPGSSWARCARR